MKMIIAKLYLLAFLLLTFYFGVAQNQTNYFSPLSSYAYPNRVSFIKERKVETLFLEKKAQKTYADILKDRDEVLISDVENNRLLKDSILINICEKVVAKIKMANSSFSFDNINVFINRSCAANACCFGEGTLYVIPRKGFYFCKRPKQSNRHERGEQIGRWLYENT